MSPERRISVTGKVERLKRVMKREVLAREYGPGDRFLSNNEFAKRFDVSPLTANRIIADLAEEGLLLRERGRGTFVTDKVLGLDGNERGDLAVTVGVVTFENLPQVEAAGDVPTSHAWHHPFRVLQAIDLAVAQAGGRTVLLNLFPDAKISPRATTRIRESDVEALLVVSRSQSISDADIEALRATGMPFVVVGCHASENVDSVLYDDRGIGFAAVEHLVGLGHERLAFVTFNEGHAWADERKRGFWEALERRGLPAERSPCVDLPQEQHRLLPEDLIDALKGPMRDVTGAVCVNDAVAVAVLGAARKLRREVPGRLSITGVDDLAQNRALELTSFQQPGHELGEAAVRVLLARRESPDAPAIRRKVQCALIPRSTTGPKRRAKRRGAKRGRGA